MEPSDCECCGYRPRRSDRARVEVPDGKGDWTVVTHVICYKCGHEWVD